MCHIRAGVPQDTLCGPVAFLVHINDLQTCCNILKYVDDSSIWEVCADDGRDSKIQQAADEAAEWASNNLMKVNIDKTREMAITFSKKYPTPAPVSVNGSAIERVMTFKLLGVTLSMDLSWGPHIDYLYGKCAPHLYLLTLLKRAGVAPSDILKIYTSMIRSVLEYACPVWHTSLTKEQSDKLESIQKRALRTIFPEKSYTEALSTLCVDTLKQRRDHACKKLFQDMQKSDHKLHHLLPSLRDTPYDLRSNERYPRLKAKTDRYRKSFLPFALAHWQCDS